MNEPSSTVKGTPKLNLGALDVRLALKHRPRKALALPPQTHLRVGTYTQADDAAILMRTIRFLANS
jgi:hypothetical protein